MPSTKKFDDEGLELWNGELHPDDDFCNDEDDYNPVHLDVGVSTAETSKWLGEVYQDIEDLWAKITCVLEEEAVPILQNASITDFVDFVIKHSDKRTGKQRL